MHRRSVLCGSGVITAALAGCTASSETDPVTLEDVVIRNFTSEPYTVGVVVRRDGDPIVDKRVSIDGTRGTTASTNTNTNTNTVALVADSFGSKRATYEIRATHDTVTDDSDYDDQQLASAFEPAVDGACVSAEIWITDAGTLGLWTSSHADCSDS